MDAHAERSTRGQWFGCSVRLRSPQNNRGVWVSRGMAWPTMGVVRAGEASAASQPATGRRSTRHDRHCFGQLEQEDQSLKKHDNRWMDIVWSLQLESFILTTVDNGPRLSQLSRPTSQPPTKVSPS